MPTAHCYWASTDSAIFQRGHKFCLCLLELWPYNSSIPCHENYRFHIYRYPSVTLVNIQSVLLFHLSALSHGIVLRHDCYIINWQNGICYMAVYVLECGEK